MGRQRPIDKEHFEVGGSSGPRKVKIIECGNCGQIQVGRRNCLYCGRSVNPVNAQVLEALAGTPEQISVRVRQLKSERAAALNKPVWRTASGDSA